MPHIIVPTPAEVGPTAKRCSARLAELLNRRAPLTPGEAEEARLLADALAAIEVGTPPLWRPGPDEVVLGPGVRTPELTAARVVVRSYEAPKFDLDTDAELSELFAEPWKTALDLVPDADADGVVLPAPGTAIGNDVVVGRGVIVLVGPGSIVGPGVRFTRPPGARGRCLVLLGRGVAIERAVEIVASPVPWPTRSKCIPIEAATLLGDFVRVGRRSSVGAGATVGSAYFNGFLAEVGECCVIEPGAVVDGSHLGVGVHVGEGARAENCRLSQRARIGRGATVRELFVAEGSGVPPGALVVDGSVDADGRIEARVVDHPSVDRPPDRFTA